MIMPYLNQNDKSYHAVTSFYGLNKSFRIGNEEFADVMNMSASDFPVLSTRKKRCSMWLAAGGTDLGLPACYENVCSAAVLHDKLALLSADGRLAYDNKEYNLGITDNKMLCIGNRLYFYPSGTLVSFGTRTDAEAEMSVTQQYVEVSEENGAMLLYPSVPEAVGNTMYFTEEPTNPEIGLYWYTTEGGLKRYCGSEDGWESVVPSLIRVEMQNADGEADLSALFKENDAVFISKTDTDYDSSYIVEYSGVEGDKAIYLKGYIDKAEDLATGRIEKKMPIVDYVIEHNGRLWACRYGENIDGEFVNEIYASALNDPTSWFRFSGTSADSYAVSIASDGKFTGVAVVNGYVTFFKETHMHRIYGSSPESFQLYSVDCAGIQEGSEESVATVNGVTYYKSSIGIMAISDGMPVKISDALGNDEYYNAIGGSDYTSYYVSMVDSSGERKLYVYSLAHGVWHCEDSPQQLVHFFSYKNNLFAFCDGEADKYAAKRKQFEEIINHSTPGTFAYVLASVGIYILDCYERGTVIYAIAGGRNIKFPAMFINGTEISSYMSEEETFDWYFESGEISLSTFNKKYVNQIMMNLYMKLGARVDVALKYDDSDDWEYVQTFTGERVSSFERFCVRPRRCNSFRIRVSGSGEVKLDSIVYFFSEGSEK